MSGEETGADAVGSAAGPATPAPLIPPQSRLQSEEELLSQEPPRERSPLARFGAVRGAGRAIQGVAAAAALGLVAVVAGSLTHGSDAHAAAASADQRVLVRLVGGGPQLTLSRDGGRATGALSVGVQMEVTVRNDGAEPERLASADVQQPGVVLDTPAAALTLEPGRSQAIGLHLTVSCDRVDLPEYPDAITLGLRDRAGHVTRRRFGFHLGHPAPTAQTDGRLGFFDPIAPGSSYFAMCSEGIQETESPSTFLGMVGKATAADPTIRYRLRVDTGNQWARVLAATPDARVLGPLGLSATTDLPAPVRVDPGVPRDVTVSEQVTDCTAASHAIADLGLANYVAQAREGIGMTTKAADPRFQEVGPLPIDFYLNGSAFPGATTPTFTTTFIQQLAAACPSLQ